MGRVKPACNVQVLGGDSASGQGWFVGGWDGGGGQGDAESQLCKEPGAHLQGVSSRLIVRSTLPPPGGGPRADQQPPGPGQDWLSLEGSHSPMAVSGEVHSLDIGEFSLLGTVSW